MTMQRSRLTLRRIFASRVLDDSTIASPCWLKDNRRLAYLDRYPGTRRNTVWTYDSETDERAPLMDPTGVRTDRNEKPVPIHSIHFSHDEQYLLLTSRAPARFTPCCDIYVYDLRSSALQRLTATDADQYHPVFSPDDRYVSFVRDNELWTVEIENGQERRWTWDAQPTVYNGRCGWVYEEELGLARSYAWSPDGSTIAFLQQDESGVPEVLLPCYDTLHCDPRRTRYPKAGDPNPVVRLGFLRAGKTAPEWVDLSSIAGDSPEEHYIACLQWTPDGRELLVQYIPRVQNRLLLLAVDPHELRVRVVLEEHDDAWVDPAGEVRFVGKTDRFIWPSERSGWRHLYLYDLTGHCHAQLTDGQWDVTAVSAVDAERACVYFLAALPNPTERHLFRVGLTGGSPERVTQEPGVHSAIFSPDCSRYLHTHSSLNRPPRVSVCLTDGSVGPMLNKDTQPVLRNYGVPVGDEPVDAGWELLTFQTEDGTTLHGRMLRPRPFDPNRRYPVLMHTYGGPGSQVVLNQWGGKGALWYHYLAERGFIIFLCDNRGTGARGSAFKKITYRQLGYWEVRDQIAGARYLASLPFVDPGRIAIWGWSYGGYMAALCILKGAEVFRAAVAVAPVTDWRLYDTIYTERYMRTPTENPDGYSDGSPVTHAKRLRGHFLLVHGTMDDNVHFQNAARLAAALQDAQKPFEAMFYPERHHGIENRHLHLYRTITTFLRRALR